MKHVTILGLAGTSATIVTGPLDIFIFAGRLWNHFFKEPMTPYFEVEIVTEDGRPVDCTGRVAIQAHRKMSAVAHTDLLIIPSVISIEETLARHPTVVPWIQSVYASGADVAAICTGAFVLAETGLLDGKTATTHWGAADLFRQRYPRVNLKPERLITESERLFTSGGSNACFDIALYLVRKYCGDDVARKLAKAFLHDLDRTSQAPWMAFQNREIHNDTAIRKAQEQLENHYARQFDFNTLSRDIGMSRRTFERRFKAATGDSPLQYLHRIRVEAAKQMLESGNLSFDEIVHAVGYEDGSFFRKVFRQNTGLSPKHYRKKWGTPMDFVDARV